MNKNLRKAVIAGNWKMNKTPEETTTLLSEIIPLVKDANCEVIACVPYVDIYNALEVTKGTNVKIGAQNCHWAKSGAYTAEISADMLKAMGLEYVIIGHSERRQYFGETDITVNLRTRAALDAGLTVLLCVGELKEEREMGITNALVEAQTKLALNGVSKEEMSKIIIAYEPVWAIGTGLTATSDQAEEVCKAIREVLCDIYDRDTANSVTIQYGGSMNDANADELLGKENVDGGLIGGASLLADKFAAIIASASK